MMKSCFVKAIKFYQLCISPRFGHHCRFLPTCSQYCAEAIEKNGAMKGLWLGGKRILKCNPWGKFGVDK